MTGGPIQAQIQRVAQQAEALLKAGKPLQAARMLAPVMEQARGHLPAALTFARSLMLIGQHAQSAEVFAQVARIAPGHAAAATEQAAVLARLGRFEEALESVRRARRAKPWFGPAVFQKADLLADMNRGAEAVELLDSYEEHAPEAERTKLNAARACAARARLIPKHIKPEAIIDNLLAFSGNEKIPPGLRCIISARASGALDSLGRYDEAFELQKRAKQLRNLPWDAAEHTTRVQACIAAWSSASPDQQQGEPVDGSGLVFIVGMPRSGSSLLEQMLSRHTLIKALGERNEITRAAQAIQQAKPGVIPFITDPSRLTPELRVQLSQTILESYESEREPGIELLTDKQPFNYAQLPLLARLLPGCRVIHTRRDPRDTCLSYYMQWMLGAHGQANTIEDLALFCRDYFALMNAWQRLPAPNARPEVYDINYEDLVSTPEPVLRGLCAFLGIEFDEAMLDHTSGERITNTASRDQVRSALYTSRIARWKYYEKHLGPVFEHLGDFIQD